MISRQPSHDVAVGVYDEPELVVLGVGGMLARHGHTGEVLRLAPGVDDPGVGVLLCDPVGRSADVEQYLSEVTAVTTAPVLVFTWSSSPTTVRRALAAGASGFVSKAVDARDLAAALDAVLRGDPVSPQMLRPARTLRGTAGLSGRETEVLELICRGLSNLEIAAQLYVSVNSVKTYVRQVYQKIGVGRRAQAVAWGLAHGF